MYLPFQLDPNSTERGHYFNVAGRLTLGVSFVAANEQLQGSYGEYARTWGAGYNPNPWGQLSVYPLLQDAIVGGVRNSLLILLGAVSSFC